MCVCVCTHASACMSMCACMCLSACVCEHACIQWCCDEPLTFTADNGAVPFLLPSRKHRCLLYPQRGDSPLHTDVLTSSVAHKHCGILSVHSSVLDLFLSLMLTELSTHTHTHAHVESSALCIPPCWPLSFLLHRWQCSTKHWALDKASAYRSLFSTQITFSVHWTCNGWHRAAPCSYLINRCSNVTENSKNNFKSQRGKTVF